MSRHDKPQEITENVQLAVWIQSTNDRFEQILGRLENIDRNVAHLSGEMDSKADIEYVDRGLERKANIEEFNMMKKIVYGGVAIALTSVAQQLVNLVVQVRAGA